MSDIQPPDLMLRLIRLTIKQMRLEDRTPIRESANLFAFVQHARDLAEIVEQLDEWLAKDGVLPSDWLADEDKPEPELCTVEHGDWTGPHHRISSCPVVS